MTSLLKKSPAVSYCIITILLSGFLLLLHFAFPAVGGYSVSFPQYAPALGALAFCLFMGNPQVFTDILKRLRPQRAHLKWYACSVLLPVLLIALSALLLSVLGLPYQPWGGDALFYILNIVFMLFGCFGEEIGWRGFLLPTLQKRFSPFASSLMIGTVWGAWHINFSYGILGFLLFTITTMDLSIIFTWIYNQTSGSVLAMGILHLALNICSRLWLWERFGVMLYVVQTVLFGIACVIILAISRKDFFRRPSLTERVDSHAL